MFELRKPIKLLSGDEVKELNLDWDSLSFSDLQNANKIKTFISKNGDISYSPKLDFELRIGIAWVAAMRGDSRLMLNDVMKLGLADSLALADETLDSYLIPD
jgi:hypothetical protein